MVVESAGGVAVHVDEPRRDDAPGRIDDTLARARRQVLSYLDDGIAGDADVAGPGWRASAVDDWPPRMSRAAGCADSPDGVEARTTAGWQSGDEIRRNCNGLNRAGRQTV